MIQPEDWALPALACLAAVLVTILWLRSRRPPLSAGEAPIQDRPAQRFTTAQVAEHNTATDCWIVLKGKVYDVTPYVDEHPGGSAILRNAGRDSTKGFFGPQHPVRVFDLIDDFCIGLLEEVDKG